MTEVRTPPLNLDVDEAVDKIVRQVIPAFAGADLRQSLAAVVALFAMAIRHRPASERRAIVHQATDRILGMAAMMAGDNKMPAARMRMISPCGNARHSSASFTRCANST
jgi:hypothetical protein